MAEETTARSLLGPQKSAALERALAEMERYVRDARTALDEGGRQRLMDSVDCVGTIAQEQVEVLKDGLWPLLYDEQPSEPGGTSVWTAGGPQ